MNFFGISNGPKTWETKAKSLEKEIQTKTSDISRQLDYMQTRLTPGALIDDMIFRSHPQGLVATYGKIKDNPLSLIFFLLGVAGLGEKAALTGKLKANGSPKGHHILHQLSEEAQRLGGKTRSKAEHFFDTFESLGPATLSMAGIIAGELMASAISLDEVKKTTAHQDHNDEAIFERFIQDLDQSLGKTSKEFRASLITEINESIWPGL